VLLNEQTALVGLPLNSSYCSYLRPAQPAVRLSSALAWRWNKGMRIVAEYLEKATEFDELARSASEPALKKRYADLAESFRLLAIVRRRLIETDALKPEQP
jgi:hypothetical protein